MEFRKTASKAKLIPNPKARLQEQVREVMRWHHYSGRTETAYWQWIKRFILFHAKRHPPGPLPSLRGSGEGETFPASFDFLTLDSQNGHSDK